MSQLVTWSSQRVVGVREVDAHHKVLAELLNDLHATVHRRLGVAACRTVVEKLHRCALSHFETEEKIMRLSGHAAFRENRAEQRELLRLLEDMLAGMDEVNSNISFRRLHELKAWLLDHIRSLDPNGLRTAAHAEKTGSSGIAAWSLKGNQARRGG